MDTGPLVCVPSCGLITSKLTPLGMFSLCNEVELESVMRKMDSDRVSYEQKLERQAQLLDARAAKINKLEGVYSFRLILRLFRVHIHSCLYAKYEATSVQLFIGGMGNGTTSF